MDSEMYPGSEELKYKIHFSFVAGHRDIWIFPADVEESPGLKEHGEHGAGGARLGLQHLLHRPRPPRHQHHPR